MMSIVTNDLSIMKARAIVAKHAKLAIRKALDERNRAMINDVLNGMTLRAAGPKYFITAERCRQIIYAKMRKEKMYKFIDFPDRASLRMYRKYKDQILPIINKT